MTLKSDRTTDLTGPTSGWLGAALKRALGTVRENAAHFGPHFPDDVTVEDRYALRPADFGEGEGGNVGWTTGFWTGQLWLAYELTGEPGLRDAALRHVQSFEDRVRRRVDTDHHDLGFLYTLSCVPAWKLLGEAGARQAALHAADLLYGRYWERAGIIQAWGNLDDPGRRGRIIVDCLMNLPLLHWASRETGDAKYRDAAVRHALNSCAHLLRPDGSTFHTYHFDVQSGAPQGGSTHQGAGDDSSWARGQAWAVTGFALNYALTGEVDFLDAARRAADYFLARVPSDGVVYWDLIFRDGDGEEKDSSASAIAACGLLELARVCPDPDDRARYHAAGVAAVEALARGYAATTDAPSGALLAHGVYGKPQGSGVDEGNLWGDYFYLEALTRLSRTWPSYWH